MTTAAMFELEGFRSVYLCELRSLMASGAFESGLLGHPLSAVQTPRPIA
jgi:hypothetical protein